MKDKIIGTFLYHDKLKFSDIERLTKLRSNKLSYYLKDLEDKNIITKENGEYSLSINFEHIIPYANSGQTPLPAVLIALGSGKNFFMGVREKKPYKGFLGLPAGRILLGESVEGAVKRIMLNKYKIKVKLDCINSVSIENMKRDGKIIHSFILILVTASTKDKIEYLNIEKEGKKIIKSDYWLLKNHLGKRTEIKTIDSNI